MSAPNSTTDYYEVLQVLPTASPEVIEAAYNGLMKKLGGDADPTVREGRRWVEEAYAVIGNAERRAAYDAARGTAAPAKAEPESPPVRTGGATVVQCARDPGVQTALRCSRCDTPICPKCMIQTPVGARCRDCARIARSPVYSLSTTDTAKAAGAAIAGGVAMGLVWGFVLLPFSFGFLSIFVGAGLGWAFTRLMEAVTRRKRGPVVVGLAFMGIGIAWGMQPLFFVPFQFALYGLVAAGVACYFAYQSLR